MIVPVGFLPLEIRVGFLRESQLRQLRFPTYCACWVFSCFHNPLNSDMDYRIFNVRTDVNTCDCAGGCMDTRKRVCTESWLWEKNPLLHWGIKPVSVVWWSDALTNWATTSPPIPTCWMGWRGGGEGRFVVMVKRESSQSFFFGGRGVCVCVMETKPEQWDWVGFRNEGHGPSDQQHRSLHQAGRERSSIWRWWAAGVRRGPGTGGGVKRWSSSPSQH